MNDGAIQRVFVTGATGFVGRHFCELLESQPNWRALPAPVDLDLRIGEDIARFLAELPVPPDAVLHLAAQSSVAQAFADPDTTFDVNFRGTLHLLRALKRTGFCGRFVFASTADAYGRVEDSELPVDEDQPLRPRNPYAASKAAAEALVYRWSQSEDFDAVIVRAFNHIGPWQDERFAVGSFARQAAAISLHRREPRIDVGDLGLTRDFTDVRDVVRAYLDLLSRGESGRVYNVGSGIEVRLGYILRRLIELAEIDPAVVAASGRLRPAEQKRMCADVRRIREATGWRPSIPLDRTLIDTLDHWKGRLAHE